LEKPRACVLTSWDDTTKLDLKLANLLEKYGIKGTFFAVTGWVGSKIALDDLKYLSEAHEVGAHTATHPNLLRISLDEAREEITSSGKFLSEKLDTPVEKMPFAYTFGEYSNKHVELVREAGYCCARTTRPFYVDRPGNFYEMPVSVWAYPHELSDVRGMLRIARKVPQVLRNPFLVKKWDYLAKRLFDVIVSDGGIFHLFGHAWQVDEGKAWIRLEEVLAHIGCREDVEYMTLSRLCESRMMTNQS
jgi:peptidoglycan/xylan/chitin deacetylase (PgdA/CDA1 family)